jgi:hypothetical protein
VHDVTIARQVTEWMLPQRECPCCRTVTTAAAPGGRRPDRGLLDSEASHDLSALEAIRAAPIGKPWVPALPVAA